MQVSDLNCNYTFISTGLPPDTAVFMSSCRGARQLLLPSKVLCMPLGTDRARQLLLPSRALCMPLGADRARQLLLPSRALCMPLGTDRARVVGCEIIGSRHWLCYSSGTQLCCGSGTQLCCNSGTQLCCSSGTQLCCGSGTQLCCNSGTQLCYGSGTQLCCSSGTQLCCGSGTHLTVRKLLSSLQFLNDPHPAQQALTQRVTLKATTPSLYGLDQSTLCNFIISICWESSCAGFGDLAAVLLRSEERPCGWVSSSRRFEGT